MARLKDFQQYDTVKITRVLRISSNTVKDPSKREPKPGDVATIIEIYTSPPGYELECSNPITGITEWLEAFTNEDLEVERWVPHTKQSNKSSLLRFRATFSPSAKHKRRHFPKMTHLQSQDSEPQD